MYNRNQDAHVHQIISFVFLLCFLSYFLFLILTFHSHFFSAVKSVNHVKLVLNMIEITMVNILYDSWQATSLTCRKRPTCYYYLCILNIGCTSSPFSYSFNLSPVMEIKYGYVFTNFNREITLPSIEKM